MTDIDTISASVPDGALTIGQIAKELGVKKDTLRKRINREPLRTTLKGLSVDVHGTKYIMSQGVDIVKSLYSSAEVEIEVRSVVTKSIPVSMDKSMDKSMEMSVGTLDNLMEIIKEKDEQIKRLQECLDQEQKLHLLDKQRLVMLEQKDVHVSFWDKVKGLFKNADAE